MKCVSIFFIHCRVHSFYNLVTEKGELHLSNGLIISELHLFCKQPKVDWFQHAKLMQLLRNLDMDQNDIRCIENLYWYQTAQIKLNGELSDNIEIRTGMCLVPAFVQPVLGGGLSGSIGRCGDRY